MRVDYKIVLVKISLVGEGSGETHFSGMMLRKAVLR